MFAFCHGVTGFSEKLRSSKYLKTICLKTFCFCLFIHLISGNVLFFSYWPWILLLRIVNQKKGYDPKNQDTLCSKGEHKQIKKDIYRKHIPDFLQQQRFSELKVALVASDMSPVNRDAYLTTVSLVNILMCSYEKVRQRSRFLRPRSGTSFSAHAWDEKNSFALARRRPS